MNRCVHVLDAFNRAIGRCANLVLLPIVLMAFAVVVLRYAFGMSYTWMQEAYVWMNSIVFIGMVGYSLQAEKHVRVDLFYARMSERARAWVNIGGVLLCLWPLVGVIAWTSYNPIMRSWRLLERSPNEGGLPFVYLHKGLIFVFCLLLFLQGLSLLLSSIRALQAPHSDLGK